MSAPDASRTPLDTPAASNPAALRLRVSGIVQGVGFRPFVYRLATHLGLNGWVKNCTGQVEIMVAGDAGKLARFEHDLLAEAPAIARPALQERQPVADFVADDFRILESHVSEDSDIHVPPDYFVCDDCLAEMHDPADRRYAYPFINCTQCGPRYTLINALPYDRPNTSMAGFELCPECRREYTDVSNRRFHAEPIACPVCGPAATFKRAGTRIADTAAAVNAAVDALRSGDLVAVKGVGGYHLLCDAGNRATVEHLRRHKPRPHKPLALMFPDIDSLQHCVDLTLEEAQLLASPARPIILAKRGADAGLIDSIAPGLDEIGVMLPYSPLHHLLLKTFGGAVVATSANISGEPVLTDAGEVEQRLGRVAQAYLHHNRPIVRPADDPVYRSICGRPRPLRLGRGNAPLELSLPRHLEAPVLAVGGHMKNTVCLAFADRAVVSPHIGDMGSARSVAVFEQVVEDLQSLYGVTAQTLLCDAHPAYATTRWAQRRGMPVVPVQHHRAHASALLGESADRLDEACLVFTWDGVGFGDDRTLWGGEAFYGRPGNWRRQATWRPFRLPGSDKAGREPWRSAISLAWESGDQAAAETLFAALYPQGSRERDYELLLHAWKNGLNAPLTSAVGRLFDAAAALTGICLQASFEGQGPMWLEAAATAEAEPLSMPPVERSDGLLETDWAPLYHYLMDVNVSAGERATVFHESMADALLQQTLMIARRQQLAAVGLCGGVFQNRRLTEACTARLKSEGFRVIAGQHLPVNDAALSFGQVIEYASR